MFESRQSRWLFLVLEATCVPLALALGWLLGVDPTASMAWSSWAIGLGVAAAAPAWVIVVAAHRWRPSLFESMMRLVDELLVPAFRNWTSVELLLVSLLAGVGEELLFRGLLQQALIGPLGLWGALVAAALVFGVVHALSASYAVFATLMGAYLGWLWMASGNLAVPIAAHAAYDFLTLAWLVRSAPLESVSSPPSDRQLL
ncbi:MAG: CPBP family intramembrane metalloprotease [Pirellulales bacterium]|nr:CPBP family intramembrane metalloprotease [Pirellulales bacterium]